MEESHYRRIFTGTAINAGLLEESLITVGISPILKNESESGRLAGFAPPVFNQVRVYVHEDEYEKALNILKDLEEDIGSVQ